MSEQKIATPYEDLLLRIKNEGVEKQDRTGTGTTSIFGAQFSYDLSQGFPLLTTKRVFSRGVIEELLWFLNGDTSAKTLQDKGVHIWDEWANKDTGLLGPVYGNQWRKWYSYSDEVVKIDIPKDSYSDYFDENAPTKRQVAGVGYFDEETITIEEVRSKVFRLWQAMIWSAYDEEFVGFSEVGAKGIEVTEFWHKYENFRDTIHLVPGFYHWVNNSTFVFDANYYGANLFSPDTTIFLERGYRVLMGDGNAIKIEGKVYEEVSEWDSIYGTVALEEWKNGNAFHSIPANSVEFLDKEKDSFVYRRKLVHDQIEDVLEELKNNPNSRRMIVSAWNPADISEMALPACHVMFQLYVANGKLSMKLTQRSADMFLGVPFNIASYSLLLHMIAQQTGYEVGEFIWSGGDCHIYNNHRQQVMEQLRREPKPYPTLKLNKAKDLFSYKVEDFEFEGYDPHPAIKADVSA